MKTTPPPKLEDGSYDREAIKALFMASKYLDWTRFAEEQGWDSLLVKRALPVKTWLKEKRDILTEKQMDILSGLIHERKFNWTHDIIKTMDNYPAAIDMGLEIVKAKMGQYAMLYKDYVEWLKDPDKVYTKQVNGKTKRNTHPWERISFFEVSMMTKALKELTEAKLKALMLDKWAISKLDLPVEKENTEDTENATSSLGPRFTIEGKEVIEAVELMKWMDNYMDKPVELPAEISAPSSEVKKVEPDGEA